MKITVIAAYIASFRLSLFGDVFARWWLYSLWNFVCVLYSLFRILLLLEVSAGYGCQNSSQLCPSHPLGAQAESGCVRHSFTLWQKSDWLRAKIVFTNIFVSFGFSLNHPCVTYTGFWHLMPRSLRKYKGIRFTPPVAYTLHRGLFRILEDPTVHCALY